MRGETYTATALVLSIAVFGILSAALLTVGWWFRNDRAAEWGLLIATGVWTARGVFVVVSGTGFLGYVETPLPFSIVSSVVSFAWAVGSAGAYLLERYDRETRGDE